MEVYPVVVGDMSGRMDRSVFYRLADICVGRKKAQAKKNRTYTEAQMEQQARFGFTGRLGARAQYALSVSIPEPPKRQSAVNHFVTLNIGNCTVVEEGGDESAREMKNGVTVRFDYAKAVFAVGSMSMPSVTMSFSEEDNSISFTLAALSGREFPGKAATDKVYAILVESALLQVYVVELGTRGDGGMVSETLEDGWSKDTTHVYAFATDASGKATSDSRHLTFE